MLVGDSWLPALLVCFTFGFAGHVKGQTFKILHTFSPLVPSYTNGFDIFTTNLDGSAPRGRLILSGNNLIGTTYYGGSGGNGTIFKVNKDGTDFSVLYTFTAGKTNYTGALITNRDGISPPAGLAISGNTLYGVASFGGSFGDGTVFSLNTDGSDFTTLHHFLFINDGGVPTSITLSGGGLYGTCAVGDLYGSGGSIFVAYGTSVGILHVFSSIYNIDGISPNGLVSSGGALYGSANGGGGACHDPCGFGTVFSGTATEVLKTFASRDAEGAYPGEVNLSGNVLYGVTTAGGSYSNGTIFSIDVDGTGFTKLWDFHPGDGNPTSGRLTISGNRLYGQTARALFKINTDGTGFTNLYRFSAQSQTPPYTNIDGAQPQGGLLLDGAALYGVMEGGGSFGGGTVFSLSFPPRLSIVSSVSNIVLSWPTNYDGFDYSGFNLRSTSDLALGLWDTNLPAPVLVNGQYTVTNPVSGAQQFFRLSSP